VKLVSSGLTGTIGVHLSKYNIQPLNQRLDSISHRINLEKGDTYFHLGGIVGPGKVQENYKLSTEINVESVKKLATLSQERELKRFVYVSTSHVYKKSTTNIREDDPVEPINIYAEQKLAAEEILKNTFSDSPEKLVILRVFSILGLDTKEFTLGGAVRRLHEDPGFTLENGDDVRDFLTPKQAADAIYKVGRSEDIEQTINICTGSDISIVEATRAMLLSLGDITSISRVNRGISDNPRIVGDPKIVNRILGTQLKWGYANEIS
jgi:nucleoside-diphosphate-sugar epimerase